MKYVNDNFLYVDVKTKLEKDSPKGPLQLWRSMVQLAIFLGKENILWINSWHNVKVSNAQIFRQFSFAKFEYLRHVPHKDAKFLAFPTLLFHGLSQLQKCPPKFGHQWMDLVKNYHTNHVTSASINHIETPSNKSTTLPILKVLRFLTMDIVCTNPYQNPRGCGSIMVEKVV
jgi:hypothetical protein